jgi:hypothetical protein
MSDAYDTDDLTCPDHDGSGPGCTCSPHLPVCHRCATPYPDLLSAPCTDGHVHDYRD